MKNLLAILAREKRSAENFKHQTIAQFNRAYIEIAKMYSIYPAKSGNLGLLICCDGPDSSDSVGYFDDDVIVAALQSAIATPLKRGMGKGPWGQIFGDILQIARIIEFSYNSAPQAAVCVVTARYYPIVF